MYPISRLRRLRMTPNLRALVRETALEPADFIAPLFVVHGSGIREEIKTMPGQYRLSVDELVKECEGLYSVGVLSVMLFGIPEHKDHTGSEAYSHNGIVQQGIRALKAALPDLIVIADICMCEYTDHGHCGILHDHYTVDNDATLPYLCRQAVSFAEAGADIVAPSDMMDGRIAAMRQALDEAGYEQLPIMSYAAKFSSAFYGPFRDAADSAPSFGDRRSYRALRRVTSSPQIFSEAPSAGASSVPRIWSRVVFPAPLAPTMEMISRGATVRSIPLRTSREPKLLCIWVASMIIGW